VHRSVEPAVLALLVRVGPRQKLRLVAGARTVVQLLLAGMEPFEAAKYRILILFLLAGGAGLGALAATCVAV
jgi:ABC-type iron transport system FetAB permease component